MIWRLQESKFGMNKWESNRLRKNSNINKIHLIWIQELRVYIHNAQFDSHIRKEKRKTEETSQYPSSPTKINAGSIWSGMEFGMASPFQTQAINRRSEIFFYISICFPWNMWNAMYRVFRKALRKISMLPLIEKIWNKLSRTIFEFDWIYLQRYSFSWVQCICTCVCNGLVFTPKH